MLTYALGIELFLMYSEVVLGGNMDDFYQSAEVCCSKVHGAGSVEDIQTLFSEIYPKLSDYSLNFIFGQIYQDPVLSLVERELLNIVALVAEGSQVQLENHILAAYRLGCTPKKIVAAIVQMIIIVGFPKVVNAVLLAQSVFKKNGIEM